MKIRKLFLGHATDSTYTAVGFIRDSAIERSRWYGDNKPISNASMNRIAQLIEDNKVIISTVYPLPKQLWIVYNPNL